MFVRLREIFINAWEHVALVLCGPVSTWAGCGVKLWMGQDDMHCIDRR